MLKKSFFAIILISLTLILASCSIANDGSNLSSSNNSKVTQEPAIVQSTQAQLNTENDKTSGQQNSDSSNSMTYEITKEVYDEANKNIKINYPQITKLKDISKQKIINTILKDEALQSLKEFKSGDAELTVLEIDYDIKLKSENILSVQYSGYANFKNAAHPYHVFFTTNINTNKVNSIKLIALVNINKGFVELFRAGKFKSVSPIYPNGYLESSSDDELIETFKTAQVYLSTDSLGISISVPYAMGDHVEFEIKYQNIESNVKVENEVWKYLSNLSLDGINNK